MTGPLRFAIPCNAEKFREQCTSVHLKLASSSAMLTLMHHEQALLIPRLSVPTQWWLLQTCRE